MTLQVTVRLPEEIVRFIDRRVADGVASSRANVVADALRREARRERAERDARILAGLNNRPDPDDLDSLAAYAAGTTLDDLA